MTGTNPGTWPDWPPKWADDLEPPERLYTAAEMKAARLEMVERCMTAVKGEFLDDPQDCEGDEAYNHAIIDASKAVEKLKEEIENE